MTSLGRIFTALILIFSASAAAAQDGMVDLPVNGRVRVMTYGYCLTGDNAGIQHLLAERIAFTGAFNQTQARTLAADWVAAGYCAESLATADQRFPTLRALVTTALAAEGFNVNQPLTQQAVALDAASKGFFSWLGKAFKAIGAALSSVFSAGGSGYYEYYETGQTKICDRQWHITVGSGGGGSSPYDPTPFYPTGRD